MDGLLRDYPGLAVQPVTGDSLMISGDFEFSAVFEDKEIVDSYQLSIEVPLCFPRSLPIVMELGGRIPCDYHKLTDGSLCLGSPLRLHLVATDNPTLPGFVQRCVIPYLYGYSFKERNGRLPFGELAHGTRGVIADYQVMFGVSSKEACEQMLHLASRPRRKANSRPCPCGSGLRVGKCHNRLLNRLRKKLGRLWFRDEYSRVTNKQSSRQKRASNVFQPTSRSSQNGA